jgi:hypothetical protein
LERGAGCRLCAGFGGFEDKELILTMVNKFKEHELCKTYSKRGSLYKEKNTSPDTARIFNKIEQEPSYLLRTRRQMTAPPSSQKQSANGLGLGTKW